MKLFRVHYGYATWYVEAMNMTDAIALLSTKILDKCSDWPDKQLQVDWVGKVDARATSPEIQAQREIDALLR